MASIAAVRAGLATRLETISGLRVSEYAPGSVSPPAAILAAESATYDEVMGDGAHAMTFVIMLLVPFGESRSAHEVLDAYLATTGSASVRAAIDAEDTLGGAAHYSRVTSMRNYGTAIWGDATYLGAELVVEVLS